MNTKEAFEDPNFHLYPFHNLYDNRHFILSTTSMTTDISASMTLFM